MSHISLENKHQIRFVTINANPKQLLVCDVSFHFQTKKYFPRTFSPLEDTSNTQTIINDSAWGTSLCSVLLLCLYGAFLKTLSIAMECLQKKIVSFKKWPSFENCFILFSCLRHMLCFVCVEDFEIHLLFLYPEPCLRRKYFYCIMSSVLNYLI